MRSEFEHTWTGIPICSIWSLRGPPERERTRTASTAGELDNRRAHSAAAFSVPPSESEFKKIKTRTRIYFSTEGLRAAI